MEEIAKGFVVENAMVALGHEELDVITTVLGIQERHGWG